MRKPPYPTVLKPYGSALLDAALTRDDILCLTGDLTRQCEIDLFQDTIPERFIHCGMAEANMMSLAGALARKGHIPFVHTFGVFATRRPFDQIVNSIAYPGLPVRIVGFMPGISSPGGPSHQAIDDIAIMRAIPGMTVIDVADAVQTRQVVPQIIDMAGPVYLRLKRGEIPVIFDEGDPFSVGKAQVLAEGDMLAVIACGMMVPAALAAAEILQTAGISVAVVNTPTIKPFDTETILGVAVTVRAVVASENHSVIGGLGSAVAETLATSGLGRPLRRIGLQDTFAEGAKSAAHLFRKYGLSTRDIVAAAWSALGREDPLPTVPEMPAAAGEYAPV